MKISTFIADQRASTPQRLWSLANQELKPTGQMPLLVFSTFQLIAAVLVSVLTLWIWGSTQISSLPMPLTYLLIVLPIEGFTIALVLLSNLRPHPYQVGAWTLLSLFRILAAFQLPTIPWIYFGPDPPPPIAPRIFIVAPLELLIGFISLISTYIIKPALSSKR